MRDPHLPARLLLRSRSPNAALNADTSSQVATAGHRYAPMLSRCAAAHSAMPRFFQGACFSPTTGHTPASKLPLVCQPEISKALAQIREKGNRLEIGVWWACGRAWACTLIHAHARSLPFLIYTVQKCRMHKYIDTTFTLYSYVHYKTPHAGKQRSSGSATLKPRNIGQVT